MQQFLCNSPQSFLVVVSCKKETHNFLLFCNQSGCFSLTVQLQVTSETESPLGSRCCGPRRETWVQRRQPAVPGLTSSHSYPTSGFTVILFSDLFRGRISCNGGECCDKAADEGRTLQPAGSARPQPSSPSPASPSRRSRRSRRRRRNTWSRREGRESFLLTRLRCPKNLRSSQILAPEG